MFVPSQPFQSSQGGAYPRVAQLKGYSYMLQSRLEGLAVVKHFTLVWTFLNYGRKTFYNIGPIINNTYRIVTSPNLRMIVRSSYEVFLMPPWANVINLFTVVIYCNYMEITLVILFYNTEWQQYHGMAVNYHGKKFYSIGPCAVLLT